MMAHPPIKVLLANPLGKGNSNHVNSLVSRFFKG